MITRSGEVVSAQVGIFGNINADKLTNDDFSLENGQAFVVKNEGTEAVKLSVLPAGSTDGVFVETTFDPGWNPEIVKVIKATTLSNVKLKFGY